MGIESNILRYYLKNVYFINGTAYAGKSTMVKMLAEKHGMIHCGENYHDEVAEKVTTPDVQPGLCYFRTMSGWQEFINRAPDEYEAWINRSAKEAAEFELMKLLQLSAMNKKIIVDTNISLEILHEISDYNHVAIMLSPQSMSVDKFFERSDPDKQFVLEQINKAENPEKTMANFRECIARINSQKYCDEFANSGFFTLIRENTEADTKEETLNKLEKHFNLI
ncbi:MAG: hypothetical protein A2Y17_09415 [Clostridiales bacterium GWF2_38_85]|nr:MAG: hypothetical protein A2Y17_09415 [Clostridiales bacterium GWF2_38_85]HBL83584.1 hypothetical protein [Clostridiales bacterium]